MPILTKREKRCRREDGFTLLELLIAVSLIAVIAVLLSSGLRFGTTVWSRSEVHREAWVNEISAYQFLQARIEAALPLPVLSKTEKPSLAFDGNSDAVTLVNADLGHAGILGDQVLRISSRKSNAGTNLIVQRANLDSSFPDLHSVIEEMDILDDVSSVKFMYYGASKIGVPEGWSESWSEPQKMPRLIQLTLTLRGQAAPETWIFEVPAKP